MFKSVRDKSLFVAFFFLSLSTVGIEDSWLIREVFVLLTRYGVFKQPFVKLLLQR